MQNIQTSNTQSKQDRHRPQELEKHDQAVTAKPRKMRMAQEHKQTYPMCMGYYEPTNVAVFALVSKEIQLHQLKKMQTNPMMHLMQRMCGANKL